MTKDLRALIWMTIGMEAAATAYYLMRFIHEYQREAEALEWEAGYIEPLDTEEVTAKESEEDIAWNDFISEVAEMQHLGEFISYRDAWNFWRKDKDYSMDAMEYVMRRAAEEEPRGLHVADRDPWEPPTG